MLKNPPRVTEAEQVEAGLEPGTSSQQLLRLTPTLVHLLGTVYLWEYKGIYGSARPEPFPHTPQAPRKEFKAEEKRRQRRYKDRGPERKRQDKGAEDDRQTVGTVVSPHTHGPPVGP